MRAGRGNFQEHVQLIFMHFYDRDIHLNNILFVEFSLVHSRALNMCSKFPSQYDECDRQLSNTKGFLTTGFSVAFA